ncbi:MAG: DUF1294 domain-containing protein [Verrucomicrobiota bacterium]
MVYNMGKCFLMTAMLLVLPVMAARHVGASLPWVAGWLLGMNLLTYGTYALDKSRAERGGWRIPEAQLHLLELLGGWPGAFLAQQRLRHKCSKPRFLMVFWGIVLLYQAAALEALLDGWLTRALWHQVQSSLHQGAHF